MYDDIIEYEMNKLKSRIENDRMKKYASNNFLDSYDYLDELLGRQIEEAQTEFSDKAEEYLNRVCPGEYVIWIDWCVHIATVEFCREVGLRDLWISEGRNLR